MKHIKMMITILAIMAMVAVGYYVVQQRMVPADENNVTIQRTASGYGNKRNNNTQQMAAQAARYAGAANSASQSSQGQQASNQCATGMCMNPNSGTCVPCASLGLQQQTASQPTSSSKR